MIMSGDLICEKKASPCEASENLLKKASIEAFGKMKKKSFAL